MSDILDRLMAQLTAVARRVAHLETLEGGGGGALADHDHSGDVGDGGQFDAANLESGAADDGDVLTADGIGGAAWEAPAAQADERCLIFTVEGDLTTGLKPLRIYFPTGDWEITYVKAAVNTAPLNQAVICDIHKNGVTIFTTQNKRPSIAASAYADDSDLPDVVAITGGTDYVQMAVDQVGTGTVGADLSVHIYYHPA